jgi:hypothetical protein
VKPSRVQYLFAKNWPAKVYFSVVVLSSVWFVFALFRPVGDMFTHWQSAVTFVVSILAAPVFGLCISLPLAKLILLPIYYLRGKLNGAPFRVGDRVRILVGPYRDRVAEVYAVWSERGQVCVEPGEPREAEGSEVFAFTQVCRERDS